MSYMRSNSPFKHVIKVSHTFVTGYSSLIVHSIDTNGYIVPFALTYTLNDFKKFVREGFTPSPK